MSKVFTCPSCGADVIFRSYFTIYNNCSYCKSVVVKHGVDLEVMGILSEPPLDLTPLQIGTSGIYKKNRFEIIGRQKVGYAKGFWNEWYVYFENNEEGWIADAQGFYLYSSEITHNNWSVPLESKITLSEKIKFENLFYTVDDIKLVSHSFSSGELPRYNSAHTKRKSVDLSNELNHFANIEYYDDNTKVFLGEYLEFDDFKFQNLREIDGW